MSLRKLKGVAMRLPSTIWVFIWNRTSDRCKRMCVLASLYARLVGCTEDDTVQLSRVNKSLGLCRDTSALRFPTLLSPFIWRAVLPYRKIDQTRIEQYITRLIQKTPCWLAYADEITMREDMRRVFEICRSSNVQQVV